MEYIEYMSNLRQAMKVVATVLPSVIDLAASTANFEKNQDLEMAVLSDAEWDRRQEQYLEVEDKLFQFNPDDEYGALRTMEAEDMKGDER